MIIRLLQYWRGLGSGDRIPPQSGIDPNTIPDIWPCCAILDVDGKQSDPEITYLGPELMVHAGEDLAGRRLSTAKPGTLVSNGFTYFGQVLDKRAPITYGGEFTDSRGLAILYRSVILPLSADGEKIDRLLIAANCREVASK